MTYKETLFFLGKCLTITHEKQSRTLIEEDLKSGKVDWDNVVKLSTSHYVFPALYCNLKRVDFLHYLPTDLVEYMKHITDLNRDRNQQIINQAKEINELLLTNKITPIFIKGTGNLLEDLYEDIAERMLGDIDILVAKNELNDAIAILKNNGYKNLSSVESFSPNHRHYPRLLKKINIGAVEVHQEMLIEKHTKSFNYETIKPSIINYENYTLLGLKDQLLLSILSKQVNDGGHILKSFSFKNAYDIFLLSKRISTIKSIEKLPSFLTITNSYLAITSTVLHFPKSIIYTDNKQLRLYVKTTLNNLNNASRYKVRSKYIYLRNVFTLFSKSFTNKEYRNHILSRLKQKIKPNA